MKRINLYILLFLICACQNKSENQVQEPEALEASPQKKELSLIILGTVQDAGSPHIACNKDCCKALFQQQDKNRKVTSLGLIDPIQNKTYIFEATPDFADQIKILKEAAGFNEKETPDGIFLTHAHIGHYTGLMYLGKEAMNSDRIPVYAMPRMKAFLEQNGPWSQLVSTNNISIQELDHKKELTLTNNLRLIPFLVPHRDEFSETVGYTIIGPKKSVLFIPDIDKWERWETNILDAISDVDLAFIDGTFYDGAEINNRDISQIPHPFIIESMNLFKNLSDFEKSKIHFIHFNHTNPALNLESEQAKQIIRNGFNIAGMYDTFQL